MLAEQVQIRVESGLVVSRRRNTPKNLFDFSGNPNAASAPNHIHPRASEASLDTLSE